MEVEKDVRRNKYNHNESRRILKNTLIVSLGFMLLFTAYSSVSSLQSSIHSENGMGQYSLAVVYAAIVVSTIFVPSFAIRKLTTKWALCISMLGYSFYIAAQFIPSFYTLMPAGIIVGICAAPLWISKCSYLTVVATEYAAIKGETDEVIVTRFFGIFFCIFQTASVWGNLISSGVLSYGASDAKSNFTDIGHCGVEFCPNSAGNSRVKDEIGQTKLYILTSVYLVCSIAAVALTAIVIDPLTRYGEKTKKEHDDTGLSSITLLFATFKQMTNSYQILIIPLTIWSGIEQGFLGSDITSAFITCSWGVEKVGYVLICYGVFDAISSVVFGVIVKYTGRLAIFCLGALINVAMIAFMFNWKPNPEAPVYYFLLVGFWGAADAIWQTQINALYGVLFPEDTAPAFSNYRLWESLGFIIAYVMSSTLCIRIKLFILLGFIFTGMLGYFATEYLLRQNRTIINLSPKIEDSRDEVTKGSKF